LDQGAVLLVWGLFNFELLAQIVWLLPLVPIGAWVGRWRASQVDKETFEWIISCCGATFDIFLKKIISTN
jgi:uncharacterized membrane protein YfcA